MQYHVNLNTAEVKFIRRTYDSDPSERVIAWLVGVLRWILLDDFVSNERTSGHVETHICTGLKMRMNAI